jgi:hypothetical protein
VLYTNTKRDESKGQKKEINEKGKKSESNK